MPVTESKRTATWPLPRFQHIEISYTTRDRFGEEQSHLDPNDRYAQRISAEVIGVVYDDGAGGESRTPLGSADLAVIDVYETGGDLTEALDAESSEWINSYYGVAERLLDDDEELFPARHLLIVDRVELIPEARGHGLGLQVLARIVRTWGTDAITVLIAGPLRKDPDAPMDKVGAEALARHWSQLGFERVPSEGSEAPVLLGNGGLRTFWDPITAASGEWESPDQT